MSLYRANPKRDEAEKAIVDFLQKIGAWVTPLSQAGVPDLLVIYQDEVYFFEVKSDYGKLTPAQKRWHLEAGARGAKVFIVKSIDDVCKILNIEG